MNKFARGILIGSVLGMVGLEFTMHNSTAKRKLMKNGKKAINKAENMMEDLSGDIW
ncbi:MAG: hypothetical protein PHY44_03175 [Lachnospiraceae bacterium]|nr:hypothetical protein [Lachnospiraceae bacterium]